MSDPSRADEWEELSQKYVNAALKLANHIESDHLLCLSLEIPTDLSQQSVFQIAMRYEVIDFLNNSRVQRLLAHMWSEFDVLNPDKVFRTEEIGHSELLVRLVKAPNHFFYCPGTASVILVKPCAPHDQLLLLVWLLKSVASGSSSRCTWFMWRL